MVANAKVKAQATPAPVAVKVPAPAPAVPVALEIPGMRKDAQMGVVHYEETGVMAVLFKDGRKLNINVNALSGEMKRKAMWHGLEQKFRDAAALPKGSTLGDKFEAVRAVVETVVSGSWSTRREGGNGDTGGLLLSALVRLYPAKSREVLKEFIAAKSKAEQAALRKTPKVAEQILAIQAERAEGSNIDANALMSELEG